jgi:hypothetical protein
MYTIVLIQTSLQGDSFEEKWHIGNLVLFRKSWKYGFIGTTVFSAKVEWCFHTCEEDWDIFGLESFDNCPYIFLDIFD